MQLAFKNFILDQLSLVLSAKNNLQEATSNISNKDPHPQQKTHQTSQHNQPNSSNLFPFEKVLFCNLIGPPGLVMHAITCLIVGKVPNRFDPKKTDWRPKIGRFLVVFWCLFRSVRVFWVGGVLYRKHPVQQSTFMDPRRMNNSLGNLCLNKNLPPPKFNSEFTPEKWWLYKTFLLGR